MTNKPVQIPPTPITPITWKTRLILLRQKLSTVIARRYPDVAIQNLYRLLHRVRLAMTHLSPLSLIIGILSFIIALQIIFGLNYLNRRFGFFRTPVWLANLLAPKIEYTFDNANRDTGYTIINQNRANGFAMLLSKANQPNVPSGQFTVEDSNISFSLKNTINFSSFVKTTENGRDLITWQNTLPDTDVVYSVVPDGLKEDIILKGPAVAKTTLKEKVRYQIAYDLTTTNVKPRPGLDGKLTPTFYDIRTGEYRFHIAPLTMIDASGVRYEALTYVLKPITGIATNQGGFIKTAAKALLLPAYAQTASPNTTNYQLIIDLPRDWLADPTRSYPVVIDPTITHNTKTAFATGYLDRVTDEGVSAIANPVAHTSDADTVGLWHMDETANDTCSGGQDACDSDSTNHGTATGTTILDAKFGKGRSFNGTSDYIIVPDDASLRLTSAATWEAWVKPLTNSAEAVICKGSDASTNVDYLFNVGGSGTANKIGLYYRGVAWKESTSGLLNMGDWNHIAATWDGTNVRFYINGQSAGTVAGANIPTSTNTLKIGSQCDTTPTNPFNGSIDDVKISNVALSAAQIAIDAQGNPENNPSLTSEYRELAADANTVGLWHFNEASGNALDSSGYGNTGTPTGTTVDTTVQKLGSAARNFDGANDVVAMAASASLTFKNNGPFTLEGWIKPTTLNDRGGFVSKVVSGRGGTYSFMTGVMANGQLTAYTGAAWVDFCPVGSIVTGSWSHVAFVYDGTVMTVYVNGTTCGFAGFTYTDNIAHTVTIGSWYSPSALYDFNGVIDEVRVSNIARTSEEIKADATRYPYAIYTSPVSDLTRALSWTNLTWTAKGVRPVALSDGETPISTSGLLAQWNFNETSGTTASNSGPGDLGPITGGNSFTDVGGYRIHTFNSSGTLTVTGGSRDVEYLVVAGGGGGGGGTYHSGGGGAGGFRTGTLNVTNGAYTITVGGGGAGGVNTARGTNGQDSIFSTITSTGGGGGGNSSTGAGLNGGSGGGSPYNYSPTVGSGTAGQGNSGGTGNSSAPNYGSGGGGGAGAAGANGTSTTGGVGGVGLASSITGSSVFYAGGGGGSSYSAGTPGAGGNGGGGAGSTGNATSGTANTGGGGGGAERSGTTGGAGGSGVVIIRYPYTPGSTGCSTNCNGTLTTFASTGSQDAAVLSGWTANNRRWGAGAIMFDNTDDYVITTYNSAQNPTGSAITVEAWVNSRGFAALDRIVGSANANTGYRLRISSASANDLDFYIGNGSAYRSCIKPHGMLPGNWYHLAATYNGATFNLYVNGKNIGSCADTFTPNWGTTAIAIGGAPEYWNGTIDSTRVYNRALSAGEILANYSAGQIEFQTRTGTDSTPNDGGWESWLPVSNETQIAALNAISLTNPVNPLLIRNITAHPDGDILKYTSTNAVDANSYLKTLAGAGTVLATDDTIEYDVFLNDMSIGSGNIDAVFTDGTVLSTFVSCHNTDLTALAYQKWYHRTCTIPSGANGKVIDWINLVAANNLNDVTATSTTYYDNLVVKNSSGAIKATLYASGLPLYNQLHSESNAANTQVLDIVKNYNTSVFIDTTAKIEGTGSNRVSLVAASPNQLETFNYSGGNTQGWIETDPNNSIDFLNRKLTLNSITATWNKSIISQQSWSRVVDRYFYGKVTTGATTNNQMALGWFANATTGDDTDLTHGLKFSAGGLSVIENGASYSTGAPVALTAEASTIGLWHFDESGLPSELSSDANTVALWHLNETTDNTCSGGQDGCDSTSTNHGVATGTTIVDAKFGKGRNFNGAGDLITIPDNNAWTIGTNFTLEFWANMTSLASSMAIIQQVTNLSNYWQIWWSSTAGISFTHVTGGVTTINFSQGATTGWQAGQWYHIALVKSGTSWKIYRNGISVASVTDADAVTNFATNLTFGYDTNTYYNGKLDDVKISNVARTDAEINTSAGNYAADSSANNNTGIPTGTTIVAGQLSNARSFTGADDIYLGNKSIADGLANLTVEAWVYPTAQTASTHFRIFDEEAVLYVGMYGAQVSFYMGNGSTWTNSSVAGGALPINQWSHVAWVKSGTSASVYINGVLTLSGLAAPATLGTSANLNYISTYDGTNQPWTGRLDEIRISNVALTQAQIQADLGSSLYAANTSYETKITLKSTGADYAIKGGAYSNWTTIYNGTGAGLTTTPMRIAVAHNNFLGSVDELAVQNDASTQLFRETFAGRQPWLEITDNGSINFRNDKLILTNVSLAWDKALISKNAFSRVAGKYIYGKYTTSSSVAAPNHVMIGWFANADTGTYTSLTHGIYFNAGSLSVYENGASYAANGAATTYVANTAYEFRVRLKSTGADYEIKGGAYANWTTIYNGTGANLTTTPMRIAIADYNGTGDITELSVIDAAGDLEFQDTFRGKQAWVEIDSNNSIDLVDNTVKLNSVSNAWSYALTSKNSYSRLAGRYLYGKYTTGATVTPTLNTMVGWAANTDAAASYTNLYHGLYFNSGALSVYENSGAYAANGPATTYAANTTYEFRITLKPIGATYEIKGGAYTDWTTIYNGTGAGNTNTPTMRVQIAQSIANGTYSELSVYDPLPPVTAFSQTISSTNLSAKSKLLLSAASDRAGTFLSTLFGESPFANYETDDNTVGLWHLDEVFDNSGGNYFLDSSANANHGTPTGSTSVHGKIGNARSFDSSSYLTIPHSSSLNISGNFTLEAWVRVTAGSGQNNGYIVGKANSSDYNGYYLTLQSNGQPRVYTLQAAAYQAATYAVDIRDNNWHFLAGVFDGTNIKLYVDGILRDSQAGTAPTTSTSNLKIGGSNVAGRYATGAFDEVRVSNAARTAEQIRLAYEYGRRSHSITFDFVTTPQAAYSSGTSVTINNPPGTTSLTDTLSVGDTIIFKETVGGVETIGQATVTAITNTSSVYGTVTLASAPSFPAGGYTTAAKVFKWQKEYLDVTGTTLATDRDAVTNLTYRVYNNTQDTNIWLDNLQSNTNYLNLNTPSSFDTVTGIGTHIIPGASITSTLNRYFQYRAIFSTTDTPVSSQLNSVLLNYVHNTLPVAPVISTPANGATDVQFRPTFTVSTTDANNDYLQYKFEVATDSNFASIVMTANQNTSQTGWSGQNAASGTAYNSGSTATFTVQSDLVAGTTYYLRATALDPAIDTVFSNPSATISFTVINLTVPVANPATAVHPTTFTANWSAVASATSYRLDVSTAADFSSYVTGYQNKTVATTSEILTNIPLSTGQTYYYRVRAVSAIDTTANSNTVTVRLGLCSAPITGSFSITNSCRFTENVDGVESGSMTITAGNTLTINNGQTIAWNSGRQIIIETGAHIAIAEGGQIKQTNLWMQDVDADQYASSLTQTAANNAPNANYKRRGTMKTYLFVDQDDTLPEGYHSRPILDPADGSTSWTTTDATASALNVDTSDKLKGPGSLYSGMTAIESGSSADGALSVTTGTTTINTVKTGTLAGVAAANTATVASTTGFAAGNEVFLIQVTGTGAGNQEFRKIATVNSGTQITFTLPLVKTYTNDGSSKAQMVIVPQFSTVDISAGATLTAPAWDGTTGGVLAFRATGTVTNAGTIDMNSKGFSGGAAGNRSGGAQGAQYGCGNDGPGGGVCGYKVLPAWSGAGTVGGTGSGLGGGAGGGTGSNQQGTGPCGIGGAGGGGASGGAYGANTSAGGATAETRHMCNNGASWGYGAAGGAARTAYGINTLATIFLGSGGGGGGGGRGGSGGEAWSCCTNEDKWANGGNGGTAGLSGAGGAGGGIIFIATPTLNNSGTIRSNGASGANGTAGSAGGNGAYPGTCGVAAWGGGGSGGGAGGGGGSGGSIRLDASSVTIGTVTATGGTAGTSGALGAAGLGGSPCDGYDNGGTGSAGGTSSAGSVGRIRCDNAGGDCSGSTPAPYTIALPNPTNAFIRRTLASPIDLSLYGHISIWVKSSITGTNILQFGIGETVATEQTWNISITAANTWEEKVFDISAISATSRDAIRYLHLKYLGGNTSGTFLFNAFTYYE